MKTLYKITALLLLTLSTSIAFCQEEIPKTKEFFLSFSDFSPLDISVKHKRQLKNNTYLKVGLIDLSLYTSNNISNKFVRSSFAFSLGVEGGIEFRKKITEHFTFFHGPNIKLSYSNSFSKIDSLGLPSVKAPALSGGIPYAVGMLINLNDHFLLSAEVNPGIYITYRKFNNTSYNVSTTFTANNKFALISLAYRL